MRRVELDLLELGVRVTLGLGGENIGTPEQRMEWIAVPLSDPVTAKWY